MTVHALTELLRGAASKKYAPLLIDSLAVNGEKEGTLRRRLKKEPYLGRVRAKTGSVRRVSTLAGYVTTKSNRPALAFAILVNNGSNVSVARRLQDDVCRAMVDWLDRASGQ